jgi:poly-gamma-glutamate capsule biosynthesis protein CapA/YwtB (metallophosphatase superfamily)
MMPLESLRPGIFMRLSRLRQLLVILAYCLQLAACGGGGGGSSDTVDISDAPNPALVEEVDTQTDYDASLISLQGTLLDQTGAALAGASISIAGLTVTTGADGSFELVQLARENALLSVTAAGQRAEQIPVYLNQPATVDTVTLDPVILSASQAAVARMLFGGDVAFGRRFLDPDESTPRDQAPPDDPDALILASDPEPGTRAVLEALRPWYQEADFGVINFETPVTDNPTTPHTSKPFAFFTLPGSVPALDWLGVDYVSLGNNHIYDYLEQGLIDTFAHIVSNSIGHSGAGLNSTQAFEAYRTTLSGSQYGFLSMTSVAGNQYAENFVADAIKGGAANLTSDADVVAAIQDEQGAGYIPVVQYHTGKEYIYEPTPYVLSRMQLAADNNVPLVITHHPHIAAGVGLIDNTVAVLGLGNLAFDQARLETMLGLVARVDMDGARVEQLRLLPVYLENYAPQLITGRLASSFLRRIGEFSHAYGALVYPYNSQGWVDLGGTDAIRVERTVDVNISIPATGSTVVDLRDWAQVDESLLELNTTSALTLQMGRDLFGHGDFEDWDNDTQQLDAARWDVSGSSRYLCLSHVYRGTTGLCSVRSASNISDSVTPNRNRIRVMGDALDTPNKDLTLFGYYKGDNAGPITLRTRYFASIGDLVFGEEDAVIHPGGSFDWQPFSADLNMPPDVPVEPGQVTGEFNARAVRIFIRQSPPESGNALAAFDELAVIGWEDEIMPAVQVLIPHAKDFLRVSGTPGTHQLTLTFGRHVPAVLP